MVGLVVALAGAVAGLSALALGAFDVIGVDATANLGVASILCSLIAIPIGVVGWRWAERRRRQSVFGQAAGLIGGTTLAAWFVLFVYALSQDTP